MTVRGVSAHPAQRAPRRDALKNRETIMIVAAELMSRRGQHVPLSEIADASGVGIGTFYRGFPDRTALLHALQMRAYGLLQTLLERIEQSGTTGVDAIATYLNSALALGGQLVLPLRGAPPILDEHAIAARMTIDAALQRFLAAGHADGTVSRDICAADVITCGAMVTQPLPIGPGWDALARRHIGLFIRALQPHTDPPLDDPPVTAEQMEQMLRAIVTP